MSEDIQDRSWSGRVLSWWPVWLLGLALMIVAGMMVIRLQRQAVIREIEASGGVVNTRSELPAYLASRLPEVPLLKQPYAVWLPSEFSNEDLPTLRQLRGMSSLSLEGTQITDDVITELSRFSELTILYPSSSMTVSGVSELKRLCPDITVMD